MALNTLGHKMIAIVGVTGTQGSSVARTFIDRPGWQVRGVTRTPTSAPALQWQDSSIEMIYGDMDHPDPMQSALHGATVVFGVTDFWQHLKNPEVHKQAAERGCSANEVGFEREIAQGKALIDAVAATLPTLERLVFSTLSSARIASNGRISSNFHFDSKAEIVKYLKMAYPDLWARTSLLTLGCYAGNWKLYKDGAGRPEKMGDDTYRVCLPMDEHRTLPFVEPNADTGPYVEALLKLPAGINLVGAGSNISWVEWCDIWGRVNGVKCTYERQDRKVIEDAAGPVGREIADMYQFFEECGYCGVDEKYAVYPWDLPIKVKYTTIEEYMRSQDWNSVLNPDKKAVVTP